MPTERTAKNIAKDQGFFWGDEVTETYFNAAERDMERHWDDLIWPMLKHIKIDGTHIVDLAAGHGRNSAKLEQFAKKITIVDINEQNIAFCKKRFEGDDRFNFINNDGATISELPDGSATFFYTFDSMVHFDYEIVQSYIREAFRVMAPKGLAFFHYSNFTDAPGSSFRDNPHWRNFMSINFFNHMALLEGFEVVESKALPWGGIADLDGATILRKPK